jgi:hypothetical protein
MTLLLPAADRVVREAVEAMLDGRTRPGAGSDISFATRSSRYRVIHGVLREATDTSLVGARFVGWLFDGTAETRVSERWETDARAVLIDELKGQIVVTSITRVHVSNALPPGEGLDLPATQLETAKGDIPRASTLHGMPLIDPEPEAPPQRPATPRPAAGAPAAGSAPAAPQQGSPVPKKLTIPPAPPIPGRQNTPIPQNRLPTPPHGGPRTQPMAAMAPPPPPLTPPPPPPPPSAAPAQGRSGTAQGLGMSPVTEDVETEIQRRPEPAPRLNPRTMLGVMAATRPPPPPPPTEPTAVAPPKDGPLPQFDLDDLDDMPTRHDPTPWGAPPKEVGSVPTPTISQATTVTTDALEEVSAELDVEPSDDGETVIPLVSRPQS